MCLAEPWLPCNCDAVSPVTVEEIDLPLWDNGGIAKGQVASTNLTLLATISSKAKGA